MNLEQLERIFDTPQSLEAFLAEVSRSSEFTEMRTETEAGPHASLLELWKYTADTLDDDATEKVMDHIALCRQCSDIGLWFTRLQRRAGDLKLALDDAAAYVTSYFGIPDMPELVRHLSREVVARPAFALGLLGPEQDAGPPPVEFRLNEERSYAPGETMTCELQCNREGYVWVLCHCPETNQTELLYPREPESETPVVAGQRRLFRARVPDPPGTYSLKAVWTAGLLLDTSDLDFSRDVEVKQAVAELLFFMKAAPQEDWHMVETELLVGQRTLSFT
jgi:hypothetical protein